MIKLLRKYTVMHLLIFNKLLLPVKGAIPNLMNNGSLGKTALGCVRLAGVLAATFKQSSSYSAASRKYNMGAFFAQWCKTLTPLAV